MAKDIFIGIAIISLLCTQKDLIILNLSYLIMITSEELLTLRIFFLIVTHLHHLNEIPVQKIRSSNIFGYTFITADWNDS